MKRVVGFLALAWVLLAAPGNALGQQRPNWYAGLQLSRNPSRLYGVALGYRNLDVLGRHIRLTASYATTRPSIMAGSNGLAEDRWLLSPSWHFRPDRKIDPFVQLDLGYTRYDIENEEIFSALDNDAFIASLLGGVEAPVWQHLSLTAGAGFALLQSSTVYPFVATVGANYRF